MTLTWSIRWGRVLVMRTEERKNSPTSWRVGGRVSEYDERIELILSDLSSPD